MFWGGFAWKNLKSLSVPAENLEQNCIQLHGILQIKLDTHWTPRKTLVLGRQPFQHIPSSWNHRVGCHDMSKVTSENLKILFNPWIVSIFLIIKVTSENLKIYFNRWIFNYFVKIMKVTSEHLNILFNPWIVSSSLKSLKSPVKTWKCVSIAEFSIILWKSLKSPVNTWKYFSILSPYFFEITKVTSEHLKILFNPLKSPVKT